MDKLEQISNLIAETKGKVFSVTFVKRTTGEQRDMLCRLGVVKHLKGGDAAYDFRAKGLIPVFDMQKGDYRSIPLESVVRLQINGSEFTF